MFLILCIKDGEVDESRQEQLEGLRQLCIPMLCLLLHTVLHTTGRYRESVALADTIASEQYELYKVRSSNVSLKL